MDNDNVKGKKFLVSDVAISVAIVIYALICVLWFGVVITYTTINNNFNFIVCGFITVMAMFTGLIMMLNCIYKELKLGKKQ